MIVPSSNTVMICRFSSAYENEINKFVKERSRKKNNQNRTYIFVSVKFWAVTIEPLHMNRQRNI